MKDQSESTSPLLIRRNFEERHGWRRLAICAFIALFLIFPGHGNTASIVVLLVWLLLGIVFIFRIRYFTVLRSLWAFMNLVDILCITIMWYFVHPNPWLSLALFSGMILIMSGIIPMMSIQVAGLVGAAAIVAFIVLGMILQFQAEIVFVGLAILFGATYGNLVTITNLRDGYKKLINFHRHLQSKRLNIAKESIARADFMANVNHELRTPLNGILGMSNLLMESALDSEQFEYAKTIHSSAELLVSLINDILDLTRIESKTLKYDPKPLYFRKTVENVIDALEAGARDKRIYLTVEYDEDLPALVHGDSARIMQVLFNLIGNAIKFTSNGGVTLLIESVLKDREQALVTIRVKDTGIGIAAESLPFIFERYRQANADIQRRFGGTGLGLAITRELVATMGGSIRVASILGAGTEFVVELPFKVIHRDERQPADGHNQQVLDYEGVHPMPDGELPLILIADDNPTNLQLLSRILQKIECAVISCDNGVMAFGEIRRWHKSGQLCCAILDYQMPGLNGAEVVLNLRDWEKQEGLVQCPVVVLTGHGTQHVQGSFRDEDQIIIMEKPVRIHELKEMLASISPRIASRN